MSYMSQQLIAAVRAMADIDFSTLPSVKFIGELRAQLIAGGATVAHAEALVAKVDVTLPPDSLTDAEITELAQHYAKFIGQMKAAFASAGISNPDEFVLQMSTPLTLKLS